jgi:hypothetical protein
MFQQFAEQGYDVVWGKTVLLQREEMRSGLGENTGENLLARGLHNANQKAYKEFVPEWRRLGHSFEKSVGTKESIVTYSQQLDVEYKQMHHLKRRLTSGSGRF